VREAAGHWRRQLQAWALPPELLASVPDSPYGWPEALWRRRAVTANRRTDSTPTIARVEQLAGPGGSVLDVGAGTGRASLPLARAGHPVTAVERDGGMLAGLADLSSGLSVTIKEGSWPEIGAEVEAHEVVLCAHVVYDVAEITPFVEAMHDHARVGVVVELTETHPWAHLRRYYRELHGLERPTGPTADDFAAVVEESTGMAPVLERWTRPPDLWFETPEEILELYGRRLLMPRSRWSELEAALGADIVERDGRFLLGSEERKFVTVWWRVNPPGPARGAI
jgi:SAM-dependent methyltransferase